MNWANLLIPASIVAARLPLGSFIASRRDKVKALEEFRDTLPALGRPAGSEAIAAVPQTLDKPLDKPLRQLTTKETLDYQNREIGKLLLRMERHYSQKMRINGVPCDCGAGKHLLDMESLCEETVPMAVDSSKYYQVMDWIGGVGPKSTDQAAKSGKYDDDYPIMSGQARDLRKEILGTLDTAALFPSAKGEPEGATVIPVASATVIPVASEEEKEQIREAAEEVLL